MIADLKCTGISSLFVLNTMIYQSYSASRPVSDGWLVHRIGFLSRQLGASKAPRPNPNAEAWNDLSAAAALLAEAHLLGELRAGRSVVRRNHRIVRRQAPLFPVLLGRHAVLGAQVSLQRLELLAVVEADQEVRRDGLADGYGGCRLLGDFDDGDVPWAVILAKTSAISLGRSVGLRALWKTWAATTSQVNFDDRVFV